MASLGKLIVNQNRDNWQAMEDIKLLTPEEAARLLMVKKDTIYVWAMLQECRDIGDIMELKFSEAELETLAYLLAEKVISRLNTPGNKKVEDILYDVQGLSQYLHVSIK